MQQKRTSLILTITLFETFLSSSVFISASLPEILLIKINFQLIGILTHTFYYLSAKICVICVLLRQPLHPKLQPN
jgi:hypothetical protein